MAIAGADRAWRPSAAAVSPRSADASFAPRYPAWLTLPSLLYYAIFFLGPMAILAVFSVSIQTGFGSVSTRSDTSQFAPGQRLALHHGLRADAAHGGGGLAAHDRDRLPGRLLDGAVPLDLQDARAAADHRAVLDVVPDPHIRAQDHPRPARLPRAGPRHQHPLHEVRRRDRPGLQLPAALHPARLRVARADGLDADRGGDRPRRASRSRRSGTSRCGSRCPAS